MHHLSDLIYGKYPQLQSPLGPAQSLPFLPQEEATILNIVSQVFFF